ncbi:MAG: tRNA (guanosine(46)-N7)-methyltransferase TrmB [Gammaproteobacteria bacterium RIFCSPHIGHO2_12_FULL_37_14]|nr:MAG: tRNA (guanosine(46)-N7)-methyltransferase TrmB [Gammaproteobacteria bacterium RIFCSPHIGHO2_12_FULL_37_14]
MRCLTPFRPRSFERRNGRLTTSQAQALVELWPQFGLRLENGQINYQHIFGRQAPCVLEIGFGSGQSLLTLAATHQNKDFIGIETHKPGIGALFLGIRSLGLTNIRVYECDAVEVLAQCIPHNSLAGIQLFFPDPWPKRRHHERRLIQSSFISQIVDLLKPHGILHLATDWHDYALHMLRVLTQEKRLLNLVGEGQFAGRSPHRPLITKFEARALREGRQIAELQFAKIEPPR